MARERFYELDIARLFAALIVVFYHFAFRGPLVGNMTLSVPLVEPISRYGYLGVEFFFMISGFVIFMTCLGKTPKQFAISRFVRLYPNYWVGALFTFLALALIGHSNYSVTVWQFLVNLTMVQQTFGVDHLDGVYWSLVVELKFYLLVFLVMTLGLMRYRKLLIALWLVLAALLFHGLKLPVIQYFLIPEWAAFFVAGVAFFHIRRDGVAWFWLATVAGSCARLARGAARQAV